MRFFSPAPFVSSDLSRFARKTPRQSDPRGTDAGLLTRKHAVHDALVRALDGPREPREGGDARRGRTPRPRHPRSWRGEWVSEISAATSRRVPRDAGRVGARHERGFHGTLAPASRGNDIAIVGRGGVQVVHARVRSSGAPLRLGVRDVASRPKRHRGVFFALGVGVRRREGRVRVRRPLRGSSFVLAVRLRGARQHPDDNRKIIFRLRRRRGQPLLGVRDEESPNRGG